MTALDLSTVDFLAVVVIRQGVAPLGADEAIAEAGGHALLIGQNPRLATENLHTIAVGWLVETETVGAAALTRILAGLLAEVRTVLLPASPDGRDLAPRLAFELDRPLLAGAIAVTAEGAEVVRWGGRVGVRLVAGGPFVATLQPGVRGFEPVAAPPELVTLDTPDSGAAGADPVTLEVLEPDPATADLAEAPRILAAGAGLARGALSGPAAVDLLGQVGEVLGAAVGATRVMTDAGWASHQRQIGTTGVTVHPELYIAFGVSGAAQHLGGIGQPKHVVSVNTDPSCPMTAMAELGIVADAADTLTELAHRVLDRAHAEPAGVEEVVE